MFIFDEKNKITMSFLVFSVIIVDFNPYNNC